MLLILVVCMVAVYFFVMRPNNKKRKEMQNLLNSLAVGDEVLTNGGTFMYENRNLEYSAKRDIEYTGEATPLTLYWDVNEFLSKGTYRVSIFADGHNIGNASFNYEK